MSNFVEKNIRRVNRNTGIVSVFFLIVSVYCSYVLLFDGYFDRLNRLGMIIVPLGCCLGLYMSGTSLYSIISYIKNPELHPTRLILKSYGNYSEVVESITEQVYDKSHVKIRYKKIIVTSDWLIKNSTYEYMPVCISDIVWVYKKITKKTYNYIIPAGKDYGIIFKTIDGIALEIELSESKVDSLINWFLTNYTEIVVGYDDTYEKLWDNNPQNFLSHFNFKS